MVLAQRHFSDVFVDTDEAGWASDDDRWALDGAGWVSQMELVGPQSHVGGP